MFLINEGIELEVKHGTALLVHMCQCSCQPEKRKKWNNDETLPKFRPVSFCLAPDEFLQIL